MRNVAVVSFAQTPYLRSERSRSEVEMLLPVVQEAFELCVKVIAADGF